MHKHILLTSISSWNQISGSNTLSTLFESTNPKDIFNIYIDPEMPDSKVASRYFNIREQLVVKSVLRRDIKTGCEVYAGKENPHQHVADEYQEDQIIKRFFAQRRWRIFKWLRELAWYLGKWRSRELDIFVRDINPDVLVFAIENYPYFNRLNEYLIDTYHPKKVIAFLWDDNFTYKQHPHNCLFRIERFFQRKQIRRIINKSSHILTISPKMKEECDSEFGVNSTVLTKPIFAQGEFVPYEVGYPIRMLYTGKLVIGRDETIARVAAAIKKININGQRVILDVYTNTILPRSMKDRLKVPGCCVLHEPVPQSQVFILQRQADVLIFAESLSDKDLTARLSFSTKLTDYFASGKCVWAIGNKDLGPISYIESEDAGLVSSSLESIEGILNEMVVKPSIISEYAKKSYDCGIRNHDGNSIISKLINEIVEY